MNDYDDLLHEPDPRYCEEHNQPVPCMACRSDEAERQGYHKSCERMNKRERDIRKQKG
jgi:hypothetical protein